ncbi:MAG: replication-associated recombination protein A [Pseudomonadota bacterium]|nr:replication-associated recombination protein A [Pseudomonadota bacterium]
MVDASLRPLADRVRPRTLDEIVGQEALLGPGRPLRRAAESGRLHSMVLWGPPGVGKTTLALCLARAAGSEFVSMSAIHAGVKDVRAVAEAATKRLHADPAQSTVLFVDEVHRFNKSQQDALLPDVESGLLVLIGATTENPSFAINGALLSRARVYPLEPLGAGALARLLDHTLQDPERGLGGSDLTLEAGARHALIDAADGDGRRLLNLLEAAADLAEDGTLRGEQVAALVAGGRRRFDRRGDDFYDQISALHKSIRGSSPDAALYWLARLLDGGCDPRYVARRLVRVASEDVGNADPRALSLALDAATAYDRLGSPEGELALAQAVAYLAVAPKSNAVYQAFSAVQRRVQADPSHPVPVHLRNAPTALMKSLGHGQGYRYAHDEREAYAAGECYLPDALAGQRFYAPSDQGLEQRIGERLAHWRALDAASERQRHPPTSPPQQRAETGD